MPSPAENLALSIVRKLQAAGHTAYFAGGCVRDRLMNRTPKDFDVATSALPDQVLALFPRSQQVGVAFGVVLVRERHAGEFIQVEVATFRADGAYTDGRRPDAVRFTVPEEDAQRRDFTCNGIFFDPLANNGGGQLHDFVGGQADIQNKILRAIGDPEARFNEDHLRMLRAARFAARLNFTIEAATRKAIHLHATQIKIISRERIGEELRMILEHPTRAAGAQLLLDLHLFSNIWPQPIPNPPPQLNLIAHLPEKTSRPLALAALALDLSSNPMEAADFQIAFALANHERDELGWLCAKLPTLKTPTLRTRPAMKKILADARWPNLHALHVATRGGIDDQELDAWVATLHAEGVAPPPFITGDILISMGVSPSPRYRRWLDALYDRQLNGELTTLDQARAAAQQLINSQES